MAGFAGDPVVDPGHGMTSDASRPFIEWRGVRHAYCSRQGRIEALQYIDACVQRNEFVSLLGPSGCGKTTLLLLSGGLMRPTEGEVLIDGCPLSEPYADMSAVFQRDLLFEWRSNLRNVLLPAEIRGLDRASARARAHELFRQTGLTGFEDKWPRELSGGMRQRVALCRALIADPHLLLMDEPFGALDALTRRQMVVDLEELFLSRRKTVLFVTHDVDEAVLLSDRVLVFSDRPARIVANITIDLPRPRGFAPDQSKFQLYLTQITRVFEELGVLRRQVGEAKVI
jgi:NitT/TauT family transport system ATP-binding protein